MCVEPLAVDADFLADLTDAAREILVSERSVLVVLEVFDLMYQCRIRRVSAWMDIKPVGYIATGPRQGHRSRGSFDVGFLIYGNGSDVARKIDIPDSKGGNGRDSHACVCKEGNHSFVPRTTSGVDNIVYFLPREKLIRVDFTFWRRPDMNFVRPVTAEELEELPESLAVAPERVLLESSVMVEREEELVYVIVGHLNERYVRALGAETETVKIRNKCSEFDAPVFAANELLYFVTVSLVDIRFTKELSLILELLFVFLDIIGVDHGKGFVLVDYKLTVSSSGRIRTAVNGSKGRYD
jgi:hypothetical protein